MKKINEIFDRVQCLGYNVFSDDLSQITEFNLPQVINTINAYSYVVASKDVSFYDALMDSDVLLPDGFPIVLATDFLYGIKIKKIAGTDIFYYLMSLMNSINGRVFFLGSSNETLEIIRNRVKHEYPNIIVGLFSPPFKDEFTTIDNQVMVNEINSFNPNVLFVGMTAPKQEKWVFQHKAIIKAQSICSIGAVFDFYAGKVNRPSKFWIKLRLEWLIRLIKEPRRLWRRYLIYSPQFLIDVFTEKIKRCRR